MESSAMQELLKNLCYKYGWSYGAFWRYDQENPMLLYLKDAYFDDKAKVLANDEMFRKVLVMGDGLVGQVAFSGTDSWVSFDTQLEENPFQFGCNYQNALQVSSDVLCTGIKTVAVVPLEPQGVVQFGSFERIMESSDFLDETKRLFSEMETVKSINEQDESLNMDLLNQLLMSPTWDQLPALLDEAQPMPTQTDTSPCIPQSDQLCCSTMVPSAQTPIQNIPELETDFELGSEDLEILASLLEDREEISLDHVLENCWSFTDTATDDQLQCCETSVDTFWDSQDFLNKEFRHEQMNESPALCNIDYNIIPQHHASSHWQDLSQFNQDLTAGSRVGNLNSSHQLDKWRPRNMPYYSTLLSNGISSRRLKYDTDWTSLGRSLLSYKPLSTSKEGVTRDAKVIKKKAKPGEARHRPKDRELQQKFYAQLRSMVPDAQKCTQDGLLKRTIKHISFLQNVSKYADKLKHEYQPKLLGLQNESIRAPETSENLIIVEALSPSRSYVIEMIWDGRPLFFETVDRLREHGLNILKGVMEAGENKMWACFNVETIRQLSKTDIYLLVRQILDQLNTNGAQLNLQLDSSKHQAELSSNVHFPQNVCYDQY